MLVLTVLELDPRTREVPRGCVRNPEARFTSNYGRAIGYA